MCFRLTAAWEDIFKVIEVIVPCEIIGWIIHIIISNTAVPKNKLMRMFQFLHIANEELSFVMDIMILTCRCVRQSVLITTYNKGIYSDRKGKQSHRTSCHVIKDVLTQKWSLFVYFVGFTHSGTILGNNYII